MPRTEPSFRQVPQPTAGGRAAMPWIARHWQEDTLVSRMLLPFALVYCGAAKLNRYLYRRAWRRVVSSSIPVVVIGNISVGGTGKTPLVVWVARYLAARGWHPGIVTRGYRGRARRWPQTVTSESDPLLVGDEPVVLARRSRAPVVADPDRPRGIRELMAHGCDVIVSDDGLQHYRMARAVEVAVIDAGRGLGNGRCLPAGPLREPPERLGEVDARVVNGGAAADAWTMTLVPVGFRRVDAMAGAAPLDTFRGRRAHAFAGIGNPARFFATLRALGVDVMEHAFPDHHALTEADLQVAGMEDVIMTEKDAVKCRSFAGKHVWYLEVDVDIDERFGEWLCQRLGGE